MLKALDMLGEQTSIPQAGAIRQGAGDTVWPEVFQTALVPDLIGITRTNPIPVCRTTAKGHSSEIVMEGKL